jgi:hypothetical protein
MPLESSIGWLVGLSENISGQRFALDREEILIGRGSDCYIQLKDPKVSRKHAQITVKAGQLTIEDLDSTQGVLINGERVDECQLKDGDRVQLGDTQLQVEFEQDSIQTVMAPQAGVPSAAGTCSHCGNPIFEGEKFCSQCGSSSVPLPPPFNFVHEAFIRLRALHRAGRMDSATYREELEKLVIQDGSGGFWMPGVESGEWFWFNGSEWIRRDPPLKHLVQAPLQGDVPTPPPPPPSTPGTDEVDDKRLMRQFVIAGGVLIAITILAVGAYAAYRLVKAEDGDSPAIVEVQPVSTIAINISIVKKCEVNRSLIIPRLRIDRPRHVPLERTLSFCCRPCADGSARDISIECPGLKVELHMQRPAIDESLKIKATKWVGDE